MAEAVLLAAASAATSAGATATAAGFTAAATSATLAALPSIATVFTAAGAFGSIMSGQQTAATAKAQAVQYELSAKQEELKGREQADKIRKSLLSTLSTQNAAFAARNIQLGSGTPVNLGNVSKTAASQDIDTAMFGANQSAFQQRAQAGQSRIDARTATIKGYTSAAAGLGSLV